MRRKPKSTSRKTTERIKIKLCEGHRGGYGLLRALGQVPPADITLVPRGSDECVQCHANRLARERRESVKGDSG